MSCIPHLLELKGDKEYMPISQSILLESGGHYKGYDFCVTFVWHGHRCGYVAVPANNKHVKDEGENIRVHGCISFCDKPSTLVNEELLGKDDCGDIWLGFDAGHGWDLKDYVLAKKLFPNRDIPSVPLCFFDNSEIRTNDYMVEQCKKIIDQLTQ